MGQEEEKARFGVCRCGIGGEIDRTGKERRRRKLKKILSAVISLGISFVNIAQGNVIADEVISDLSDVDESPVGKRDLVSRKIVMLKQPPMQVFVR